MYYHYNNFVSPFGVLWNILGWVIFVCAVIWILKRVSGKKPWPHGWMRSEFRDMWKMHAKGEATSTVSINSTVPDFEAEIYQAGDIKKVRLSDYIGKWVVIIFYPADFTYVCPTELEDAQKLYAEFKKDGAEVISVSTDTAFSHKAWHDTSPAIGKVEYPMMADPTGNISRQFGVYINDEGMALRGTFIIDPDGVLKTIEINNNDVGRSAKESLRKFHAAKFVREHPGGNVCPANWEPGKEHLHKDLKLVGKI